MLNTLPESHQQKGNHHGRLPVLQDHRRRHSVEESVRGRPVLRIRRHRARDSDSHARHPEAALREPARQRARRAARQAHEGRPRSCQDQGRRRVGLSLDPQHRPRLGSNGRPLARAHPWWHQDGPLHVRRLAAPRQLKKETTCRATPN